MLIYCKDMNRIINLDNVNCINIVETGRWYNIIVETDDSVYTICSDESEELMKKVMTDIYIHMTYGSGNYILDLNEFKEDKKHEKDSDTV